MILPEISPRKIRVLVVDDMPDNRVLVKAILQRGGFEVELASDGSKAIQLAVTCAFDLVLLDIQMPDMDGFQVLAALRANGYNVPVVAFTAHAMQVDIDKSFAAGFAAHVTKPVDKVNLFKTIIELTGRKI